MFKQYLLNSIIKEMKIVRRLSTLVPADKINFKSNEDARSIIEVLQYLSTCGTGTIEYWYRKDTSDFKTFYAGIRERSSKAALENFVATMDAQIELITKLFENISEDDLLHKIVDYPWGATAPLGEAIIETNIKWLTGYKLQLFSLIKHASKDKMGTPDAWRLTDIAVNK